MAENMAVQFEEDDYFSEPDYDQLSDEELDELYNFGELRSIAQRKISIHRKAANDSAQILDFNDEEWLEMNFDADDIDEFLFDD